MIFRGNPKNYLCEIQVLVQDKTVPGRVIFGPEDTEPILGVKVLEMAGLVVDPKSHRLRRLPALYLK